jgi:hypothetical protein
MTDAMHERLTDNQVSRALTAHHEGAHVMACLEYDIPFDHVRLVESFWSSRVDSGYVGMKGDLDMTKIEQEIVMMYAGLAAEAHWLYLHPGYGTARAENGEGDTNMAKAAREGIDGLPGEPRLRAMASLLVQRRWHRVVNIAGGLDLRRRLSAGQAKRAAK